MLIIIVHSKSSSFWSLEKQPNFQRVGLFDDPKCCKCLFRGFLWKQIKEYLKGNIFSGVDDIHHKHPWYAPGTAPIASPCGTLGMQYVLWNPAAQIQWILYAPNHVVNHSDINIDPLKVVGPMDAILTARATLVTAVQWVKCDNRSPSSYPSPKI